MIVTFNNQELLNFFTETILNPYLIEFSYPKNPKMCDPILVTPLKIQPHSSQSSRENATPSSGTSPLASYKEVTPPPPPPPGMRCNAKVDVHGLLVVLRGCQSTRKCPVFLPRTSVIVFPRIVLLLNET